MTCIIATDKIVFSCSSFYALFMGVTISCSVELHTKPARKFAKGTFENGDMKGITLLDIRKSNNNDLLGRIGSVTLDITVPPFPEMDCIKWCFYLSSNAEMSIKRDEIDINSEEGILIVDNEGSDKFIIQDFEKDALKQIQGKQFKDGELVSGCIREHGLFAKLSNQKAYEIDAFYYTVPICVIHERTVIKPNGKPVIYIKSDDGIINKLITDQDLLEWGKNNGVTKVRPPQKHM